MKKFIINAIIATLLALGARETAQRCAIDNEVAPELAQCVEDGRDCHIEYHRAWDGAILWGEVIGGDNE